MNIEELRSAMSAKITTLDEFKSILRNALGRYYKECVEYNESHFSSVGNYLRDIVSGAQRMRFTEHLESMGQVHHTRWWALREAIRCDLVPDLHDCMMNVVNSMESTDDNVIGAHIRRSFLRPSTTEPGRWIYTASIEDGEQDRQRLTTLTKFLRACPVTWHRDDSQYATFTAFVTAYMSPTVTIWTTTEQIIQAYNKGPSSCMSEKGGAGYWKRAQTGGHHPVEAYDPALGWGIAVVASGEGDAMTISQRAMVWHNPDDANDKRYIRIYGSGPLQRQLERNGYTCKGAVGARLRRFDLSKNLDHADCVNVLAPYLDGAGGRNDGTAVTIGDDNTLLIIDSAERGKLTNISPYAAVQATNTCGWVVLDAKAQAKRMWTCAVTGKQYDSIKQMPEFVFMSDGEVARIGPGVRDKTWGVLYGYGTYPGRKDRQILALYAHPDTPRVKHDGNNFVRNAETLDYLGLHALDPVFYPESGDTLHPHYKTAILQVERDGAKHEIRVLEEDLVDLIVPNPDATYGVSVKTTHKDLVDRAAFVRIRMIGSRRTLRSKDVKAISITRKGKVYESVVGAHLDLGQDHWGEWCMESDILTINVLGKRFRFNTAGMTADQAVAKLDLAPAARELVDDSANSWDITSTCNRRAADGNLSKQLMYRLMLHVLGTNLTLAMSLVKNCDHTDEQFALPNTSTRRDLRNKGYDFNLIKVELNAFAATDHGHPKLTIAAAQAFVDAAVVKLAEVTATIAARRAEEEAAAARARELANAAAQAVLTPLPSAAVAAAAIADLDDLIDFVGSAPEVVAPPIPASNEPEVEQEHGLTVLAA